MPSAQSTLKPQLLLRARIVAPISHAPINDGAVLLSGERIVAVGRWRDLSASFSGRILDLGEMILLPGLVNTHCHLDYTHMAGQFPPPKRFTDWIKVITTTKAEWAYSEFAASWLAGAKMLLRTGTTTVGPLQQVTRTLPIVFVNVSDPVSGGFVRSLARPGGNMTGFASVDYGMSGKWLELLRCARVGAPER